MSPSPSPPSLTTCDTGTGAVSIAVIVIATITAAMGHLRRGDIKIVMRFDLVSGDRPNWTPQLTAINGLILQLFA
jgi:hypothetical protein